MGQRHQIFIRVENPVKRANGSNAEKPLKKLFGNNKYAIIALHHQWLYGRSAAVNALSIFDKANQEQVAYGNPFDNTCNIWDEDKYIQELVMLLSVQLHPLFPRGTGVEPLILLNSEDFDITKDFTRGDNNDGITVIDTIENKYCFANPYGKSDVDPEYPSIFDWESMAPKSAKEYLEIYYSTDKNSKHYTPENEEENQKILDLYEPYKVMTQAELKKLSPKSF